MTCCNSSQSTGAMSISTAFVWKMLACDFVISLGQVLQMLRIAGSLRKWHYSWHHYNCFCTTNIAKACVKYSGTKNILALLKNVWMFLHYITKYQTKWQLLYKKACFLRKTFYKWHLHGFRWSITFCWSICIYITKKKSSQVLKQFWKRSSFIS